MMLGQASSKMRGALGGLLMLGAALASLPACDGYTPGTKAGELGNGRFRYVCLNARDAACMNGQAPDVFPGTLAVGSEFGVQFLENGSTVASGSIEPASPDYAKATPGGFRALKAGVVALLARGSTGSVLDLTHVTLVAPMKLRLSADHDAPARTLMKVGDEQTLWATPVDAEGSDLGGAVTAEWSSSDVEVLALTTASTGASMGLLAKKAGKATINVHITGYAATGPSSLTIEVTP